MLHFSSRSVGQVQVNDNKEVIFSPLQFHSPLNSLQGTLVKKPWPNFPYAFSLHDAHVPATLCPAEGPCSSKGDLQFGAMPDNEWANRSLLGVTFHNPCSGTEWSSPACVSIEAAGWGPSVACGLPPPWASPWVAR